MGGGDDDDGAQPSPRGQLCAVMGKTAKKLTAAREAQAKAKEAADKVASAAGGERQPKSVAYDAPVAALAVLLGDRGGSCTGFVDHEGLPCGMVPVSKLLLNHTGTVHASVASAGADEGSGGGSRRHGAFEVWWSLM